MYVLHACAAARPARLCTDKAYVHTYGLMCAFVCLKNLGLRICRGAPPKKKQKPTARTNAARTGQAATPTAATTKQQKHKQTTTPTRQERDKQQHQQNYNQTTETQTNHHTKAERTGQAATPTELLNNRNKNIPTARARKNFSR